MKLSLKEDDTLKAIYQKIQSKLVNFTQRFSAKVWSDNSIVFYTGHTDKQWSPLDLKTGIGGSEIALINLAKEWAKLGYQVTVFNNCGLQAGIYDGVEYLNIRCFNQYDTFNTLIIWRYPWRLHPHTKAKRIWLEVQEFLLPEQVTKEKLKSYARIFVKSQNHRRLFSEISDDKIRVIPNGVDPAYSQYKNIPKDPYKLIYASNYSRGLERMLTYGWSIIKREIPEARLYIYYGWSKTDELKPEGRAWKQKMLQLMSKPGVIEGGRIGVEELIKEKATSSIHYYGCTFKETDCISVRESALVGCIPVTTSYAALGEKSYCHKVPGNPYQQETHEKIAYQVVELLKNQEKLAAMREQFHQLAVQETWDKIAKAWLDS